MGRTGYTIHVTEGGDMSPLIINLYASATVLFTCGFGSVTSLLLRKLEVLDHRVI
jgi:hypothetical protein